MKDGKKKSKKKQQQEPAILAVETEAAAERTPYDHSDEAKRLNRVVGQVEGIRKMLEAGRSLNDILIQFKAVHSALRAVEQRIFENFVSDCVGDIVGAEKRKEREAKISELLDLYKQV